MEGADAAGHQGHHEGETQTQKGEERPSEPADTQSSKDQDKEGGMGTPQDGRGVCGAKE